MADDNKPVVLYVENDELWINTFKGYAEKIGLDARSRLFALHDYSSQH